MTKLQIRLFVIALALFIGCGRHAKFSHQVAKADRVVITKKVEGRSVSISVVGEEVRSVVEAIASGEMCGDVAPPVGAATVEFFRGTKSLGTMYSFEGIFWTRDGEYEDHTGTLRSLDKMVSEKRR